MVDRCHKINGLQKKCLIHVWYFKGHMKRYYVSSINISIWYARNILVQRRVRKDLVGSKLKVVSVSFHLVFIYQVQNS